MFGDPPAGPAGNGADDDGRDPLRSLGDNPGALHEYFMQGRSLAGLLRMPNITAAAAQPRPQWRETHVVRADARIDSGSMRMVPCPVGGPSHARLAVCITSATPVVAVAAFLAQDVRMPRRVAIGASAATGQATDFTTEVIAVSVSRPVALEAGAGQAVTFDCSVDLSRLSPSDRSASPDAPDCYWPVMVVIRPLSPAREVAPGPALEERTPGPARKPDAAAAGDGTADGAAEGAAAAAPAAAVTAAATLDPPLVRRAVPLGGGGSGEEEEEEAAAVDPACLWAVSLPSEAQHVVTYADLCGDDEGGGDGEEAGARAGAGASHASEGLRVCVREEKVQVPQGVYVVREVFGGEGEAAAEDAEATECVVCLSAERDTVLLPCRHMCVCSGCAQQLRRQTNKCPVCRAVVALMLRFDADAQALDAPITAAAEPAPRRSGASAVDVGVGGAAS